ncbi:MAG: hypothetical protein QHJ73_16960, partial [Armatimonadota bacterium]|nr:hypothetical protein [Armatimonadota bacterium]
NETFFDDVRVEPTGAFVFDRAHLLRRNGTALEGDWRFLPAPGARIDGDTGPHLLAHEGKALSRYVVGDPMWKGGVLEARVRAMGAGGWAGLLVGYQDEENWTLARWRVADPHPQAGGRATTLLAGPGRDAQAAGLQLIRCHAGKKQVVAEGRAGLASGQWHEVQVDCTAEGFVHLSLDGRLRLRAAVESTPRGCAGVYTWGTPRVEFCDLTLRTARQTQYEQPVANEVFRNDPFMRHWASALGQWFPVKEPPNAYWNKGDFFDAFTITFPLTAGVSLTFGADAEDFSRGYRLSIENPPAPADAFRVALYRLGEAVKSASVPKGAAASSLTLHRAGDVVWVTRGDQQLFSLHDRQPLPGRHVGVVVPKEFDLTTLDVRREGIADYPFEEANCDWDQYGNWLVTNRFSCTPTWSHLTAMGERACVLWNKYAYEGDLTVEFYAGMRMQSDQPMYYPRPGDLNVTICGDGLDLISGYSYLVGAWDKGWTQKWTRLLRGDVTVAETDTYTVPRVRQTSGGREIEVPWVADGRPIHGAWYYIKIQRAGNRVRCFFDNKLVLSYDDPNPLPGRRVAIWTQQNQV